MFTTKIINVVYKLSFINLDYFKNYQLVVIKNDLLREAWMTSRELAAYEAIIVNYRVLN